MDRDSHVFLARWAADCAERVLPLFTRSSDDARPKDALTHLLQFGAIAVHESRANGGVRTSRVENVLALFSRGGSYLFAVSGKISDAWC